jgi:23S rRNA (cytidine2498-2'-O)-methyltransferase
VTQHAGADPPAAGFLFVTCQVGAEAALKGEMQRRWPSFRFAYSRPGFLTFKLPPEASLDDTFGLDCVFARAWGFCLGKVSAKSLEERVAGVWQLAGDVPFAALHVWQRDLAKPGFRGFEPHVTPAALQAEAALRDAWPPGEGVAPAPHARTVAPGQRVLDCILVEPEEWWVGWHRATAGPSCFPGGVRDLALPEHAVSRAYLKLQDALAWSELPIERAQHIVELGCSPGGASQALLDRGLLVTGIDPAEVDEQVLSNPHFTHVRKRADDVRRREFRGVHWLAADMNVAPQTTLDTVEAIVTHEAVNIRGLLLTLKLLDWDMADAVPEYLERIKRWGYGSVRARQLAHHRQEFVVAALRTARKRSRSISKKRRAAPAKGGARRKRKD